jgi:hypothetical protein
VLQWTYWEVLGSDAGGAVMEGAPGCIHSGPGVLGFLTLGTCGAMQLGSSCCRLLTQVVGVEGAYVAAGCGTRLPRGEAGQGNCGSPQRLTIRKAVSCGILGVSVPGR